jgi:TPR repeat protein
MKTSLAAAWLAPALALALVACKGKDDQTDATRAPGPSATGTPAAPTGAADGAADSADKGAAPAADDAPAGKRLCGDFEACRAACAERKPGSCARMGGRATDDAARKTATQLLRRLCDAGFGEACFEASTTAPGKPRDRKLLTRSCDMGSGWGCLTLAAAVRSKDEARADELRARGMRQLEKSCQHDDPFSCARIAEEARSGDDADPARARWHGEKACEMGDEDACRAVADQLKGEFPDISARLMERACELGQPDACKADGSSGR